MNEYDDIIDLPHPVSKKHTPMPMRNRAAQFAPFAAVNGYDPERHGKDSENEDRDPL